MSPFRLSTAHLDATRLSSRSAASHSTAVKAMLALLTSSVPTAVVSLNQDIQKTLAPTRVTPPSPLPLLPPHHRHPQRVPMVSRNGIHASEVSHFEILHRCIVTFIFHTGASCSDLVSQSGKTYYCCGGGVSNINQTAITITCNGAGPFVNDASCGGTPLPSTSPPPVPSTSPSPEPGTSPSPQPVSRLKFL